MARLSCPCQRNAGAWGSWVEATFTEQQDTAVLHIPWTLETPLLEETSVPGRDSVTLRGVLELPS